MVYTELSQTDVAVLLTCLTDSLWKSKSFTSLELLGHILNMFNYTVFWLGYDPIWDTFLLTTHGCKFLWTLLVTKLKCKRKWIRSLL